MSSEESGTPEQQSEHSKNTGSASPVEHNFFAQLRERNVIKVGVGYILVAWVIMQVAELVFNALGYPPWILKLTVVVLILGAPVAVIGAWIYEITPRGLKVDDRDLSEIPRLSTRERAIDIAVIAVISYSCHCILIAAITCIFS